MTDEDENSLITLEDTNLSRRTYLAIASTLAAPTVAGCSGGTQSTSDGNTTKTGNGNQQTKNSQSKAGGTLYTSLASSLNSLDPITNSLTVGFVVTRRMLQRLFKVNENMSMSKELAKDVKISDDGTTWTISLRQGVQFHPPYKREMTAKDVVFNYDRITSKQSAYRSQLNFIKSYKSVDKYTVRFKFDHPNASAKSWLGYQGTAILSPDAVKKGSVKNHPVGTGPFKFDEWVSKDHLSMSKFKDYSDPNGNSNIPFLDKVVFKIISDPSVKITELQKGNLDIVRSVPKDLIKTLKSDDNISVRTKKSPGFRNFRINPSTKPKENRAPQTPTSKLEVRQAIQEAVDRKALIQVVESGYGTPTETWFPDYSKWHIDYTPFSIDANPKKAKQLIKKAGFSTPLKINMISASDDQVLKQMGRVTQNNLSQAGFDPQLKEYDAGTWIDKLFSKKYDLSVDYWTPFTDPDGLREPFFTTPAFNYDTKNKKEVKKLLEEGIRTSNSKKREKIYTKLQKIIVRESAFVSLYFPTFVQAVRKDVKNYNVRPYRPDFELEKVWLANS